MDIYQATYDAVRSRVYNGDIGAHVLIALESSGMSEAISASVGSVRDMAIEHTRPSVLYRPKVCIDGNMWCALYGGDLQDGVAGFGTSVAAAMEDFDKNWHEQLKVKYATSE